MTEFVRGPLCSLAFATVLLSAGGCASPDEESKTGDLIVSVSGEELALSGYAFPPSGDAPYFADGWDVTFEKVLLVVGGVELAEDPDRVPSNQAQRGAVIQEQEGPWAVNLADGGTGTIAGKGPGHRAWPIVTLKNIPTGRRLAFSYHHHVANDEAELVGIDAKDPDWVEMKKAGYTHFFIGTARRTAAAADCRSSAERPDLPVEVDFRLGFTLEAELANCQNPDLSGTAIDGEESPRGILIPEDEDSAIAQITVHTDHLFWPTVDHGAVPLFDHLAAQAQSVDGRYLVTVADLESSGTAPITTRDGEDLPWTSCVSPESYTLPTVPAFFAVDTEGLDSIADLGDFVRFNAATSGHLNQDGICYVEGAAHSHE